MEDTINAEIFNIYRRSVSNLLYYPSRTGFFNYYRPLGNCKSGTNTEERQAEEELSNIGRSMVETACKVNNLFDIVRL